MKWLYCCIMTMLHFAGNVTCSSQGIIEHKIINNFKTKNPCASLKFAKKVKSGGLRFYDPL